MAQRILLVDDEADIREFISYNLRREGYEVYTACDGAQALEVAQSVHPHLILLDMMMPVMDGRQTCKAIRTIPELKDTMIIFLSAVQEEQCQLDSYDAGADDYITKPVSMRVLCSRVGAVMKRLNPESQTTSAHSLTLDAARRVVITPQGEYPLPRKEFEILQLLLSQPGKVFTREEIFRTIWGCEVVVGDRTLDVHIRRLRRKLGDETIVTYKGVGFRILV
ncbi:MAG: response regulator transcription factor [Alistipes sp.]|nr:response regulator transcription factor [Alistipes sp.]